MFLAVGFLLLGIGGLVTGIQLSKRAHKKPEIGKATTMGNEPKADKDENT